MDEVVAWAESDPLPTPKEHYPKVAAMLESLTDQERQVALIRLAADLNNGSEHFDHSDHPIAYSWLCVACAYKHGRRLTVSASEMFS